MSGEENTPSQRPTTDTEAQAARDAQLEQTRLILSGMPSGVGVNKVRELMNDNGFTAAEVLNYDGVNLSPEAAEETLAHKFRDILISDARQFANNLNDENHSYGQEGNAYLAGARLEELGIDADVNKDGIFSKREIQDAIKGLHKLEFHPVTKEDEAANKTPPNSPEQVAMLGGKGGIA
jgi:hypothetical protein